ncbi:MULTISPECIES: hypothetical protein [Sorangium]|uniref:Secreted protein n=1 Tax=Sorangium cellulosum (strain So ce56) TaxID=448385 RepID=A9FAB3_SORC5|nr:hypothetical protein [Sorangium cellulosum]CAN97885.1 putative secreted protein [Sorangium cellulosum So ce56]
MKRNKLMWFGMALLVSACAAMGCAAPDAPAGNLLDGGDDVPASVVEAAQQGTIYEVSVTFEGETTTVQAQATVELRAHLLDAGFRDLHGEEAVTAFLTAMAQHTVDETGELPEGILTVGDHEGDPSELAPNDVCLYAIQHDVYVCTAVCANCPPHCVYSHTWYSYTINTCN